MFSQKSGQAIFEMGNVELIELKTSRIQCPPCPHNVFKGTIICVCGQAYQNRPGNDTTYQAKHPSSVRLCLLQGVTNTDLTCGKIITTKQKTYHEVRKRKTEIMGRSGMDCKMT